MASVYLKRGRWNLRIRDQHGRWRDKGSTARTTTEAKRLVGELETKYERARLGLETLPPEDGGGTLGELMSWWLKTHSAKTPSHDLNVGIVTKHFASPGIADLPLVEVTSGKIENLLQRKVEDLSPQTLNHLRRFILTVFNCARRARRWHGDNPAKEVRRRRVPRSKSESTQIRLLSLFLPGGSRPWSLSYAKRLYAARRKWELVGLSKSDFEFPTVNVPPVLVETFTLSLAS